MWHLNASPIDLPRLVLDFLTITFCHLFHLSSLLHIGHFLSFFICIVTSPLTNTTISLLSFSICSLVSVRNSHNSHCVIPTFRQSMRCIHYHYHYHYRHRHRHQHQHQHQHQPLHLRLQLYLHLQLHLPMGEEILDRHRGLDTSAAVVVDLSIKPACGFFSFQINMTNYESMQTSLVLNSKPLSLTSGE